MKRKTKFKIAAGAIASILFLSGCQGKYIKLFRSTKAESSKETTSMVSNTEIELSDSDFKELEEVIPEIEIEIGETLSIPTTEILEPTEEPTESTFTTEPPETTEVIEETTDIPEDNQQTVEDELTPERVQVYPIGFISEETELKSNTSEVSPIIKNLEINEKAIRIFSCGNGWDLIKYNEYVGYVRSNAIVYTNDQHIVGEDYVITKHNDIVVTTTVLNFRKEPNAEAELILTFNEQTELEVLAAVSNGWLVVRYNGEIGFVHGDYTISMLEMVQNIYPELQLEELRTKKIVYSNTDLNIRCGNSIEFEALGQLKKYETVRVLEEYDDWYFIITNERDLGFIKKEYTTTIEDKCIVIDKSSQQLYLYNENELIYTTEVTTGKDETPSDTGLFEILTKARDVVLTDTETYWSPVEFWLRYNGGEGIHDADWRYLFNDPKALPRNTFGSELYHTYGSHGCINTPYKVMEKIYKYSKEGDRVLVHK